MDANLKDLESRGFVVVTSFLSADEVQLLVDDFQQRPLEGANRNYGISVASARANKLLLDRIGQVLAAVAATTNLRADRPDGGGYFAIGRGISFAWHQDHESFFAYQNHYDYLNFYIPIVKPRRDKSNLSIVPFDVLAAESPRIFNRVVNSGATRFVRVGRRRLVFCDDTGTVHVMSRDIERMAHTPLLAQGDLLLMRGDVIHRTQDTETERVSVSFRVSSSNAVVRRARLADGGLEKARMMAKNPEGYMRMFTAFEAAGKDELGISELRRIMAPLQVKAPQGNREFFRYLLAQKRRAGVLGRFFRNVAVGMMATRYATLLERFS
jgi:hypothetical protein